MLWCGGGGGKGALESSGERSEKQLRLNGGSGEEGTEAGKVRGCHKITQICIKDLFVFYQR